MFQNTANNEVMQSQSGRQQTLNLNGTITNNDVLEFLLIPFWVVEAVLQTNKFEIRFSMRSHIYENFNFNPAL